MKSKIFIFLLFFITLNTGSIFAQRPVSQEVKWLRVGSLHYTFAIEGAEFEMHRTGMLKEQNDGLSWPSQFVGQDNVAAKSLWIGTTDFADPVSGETYKYKVIAAGPRVTNIKTELMPVEFKLYGKFPSPLVIVDGDIATDMALNDVLDEEIPDLVPDRMIYHKLHTSIGITITRKMMAFSQQYNDNYFIYEYTFKNTGIINTKGEKIERKLTGCVFHFGYRYALGGEAYEEGWLVNSNIGWGKNTMNQVIGQDPAAGDPFRAEYSWYGHHSSSPVDDWGCPNYVHGGNLGGSQYVGCVVLHADVSATDKNDDPNQPTTTLFLGSDDKVQGNNQYDPLLMTLKYEAMTAGHPEKTHADEVGDGDADQYGTDPGGYSHGQGFGPYDLAPGDSIRIVLAEGVSGIDRLTSYKVGENWFRDNAPFTLPDGTPTDDRNEYKKQWVITGEDSLKKMFQHALDNYDNGYNIPVPPPPPQLFEVKSGGDRITITWANNAESFPQFNGYRLYRAIDRPDTTFELIFECDAGNVVNSYDDTKALRGRDYYYYIQSKDDGSTNTEKPGVPLTSSLFYTITNKPAYLRRPAAEKLSEIRIVPNPYHIRARDIQFGELDGSDRLAFYGLPPECTIKIYTERGDLIETIEHTDGSGDELWHSLTSSRQIVVSGLYIAYFETPEGESTFRKFVIIR
ncbi:hypothetical protein JW935_08465, partial [candidate division KSB1 bacterium]|nr:hypothetical protein [candidate division KSB1 bacterium]